jgi:hypothetical protein
MADTSREHSKEKHMKYTASPWYSRGASIRPAKGPGSSGGYKPLASAQHDKRLPDNRIANARMIAAAPELYEALALLMRQVPEPSLQGEYTTGYLACKVALHKAINGEGVGA